MQWSLFLLNLLDLSRLSTLLAEKVNFDVNSKSSLSLLNVTENGIGQSLFWKFAYFQFVLILNNNLIL
jgi:hypothetical protein